MARLASSRRALAKSLNLLDVCLVDGKPDFRNELFECNQRVEAVKGVVNELERFGLQYSGNEFKVAIDSQRIQVSFTELELMRIERQIASSKPN